MAQSVKRVAAGWTTVVKFPARKGFFAVATVSGPPALCPESGSGRLERGAHHSTLPSLRIKAA